VEAWTDERLDDLAAALRPLPEQVARNTEAIERMSEDMRDLRREMHAGFAALQRQFALIGWTLAFTVIGAVVAVLIGA
jgi:hypothetical protein